MIDTEHLEGIVRTIDAGAEERGWNEGHFFVNVVGIDAEGCDVGFKDIDGHPLNHLLGFTAPTEWLALGVCAEGWAASMDAARQCRPSQAKGRMRIRTTCVVTRDGAVASGMRVAGEEFELMPGEGEGT